MSLWDNLRDLYASLDRRLTALERGGPAPPTTPGGTFRAPMLLGYASVHDWWMAPDQAKIVNALTAAGLTLTRVEFASDEGEAGFDHAKAQQFVDLCRAQNITVLIDAVNYNDELVKREWTDEQYRQHIRDIRDIVGTMGVLLEPVSEPSDEKARRWHQIAYEEWGTESIVLNTDDRFRPWTVPLAGALDDLHFCDYGPLLDSLRSGRQAIHSTDCTPLLSRYWDEAMVQEAVGIALQRRTPLLIYDTFPYPQGSPTRYDVIAWMGAMVQGRPVEPPLPAGNGVTVNAMSQAPWGASGRAVYAPWWFTLEELANRGPLTLIAADWSLLPALWPRLGFPDAREKLIWWVFSRRIWPIDLPAGAEGSDLRPFQAVQEEITAWWERYIERIVWFMQRFPALTLTIVVGDEVDSDETTAELRQGTLKLIPPELHGRITDRDRTGHPL